MSAQDRETQRQIEQSLGNAGRLKILRALALSENHGMTKYGLEKATKIDPIYVRKHLKVLVDSDWVKEHDYDTKVYTLNPENPKTESLLEFFRKIGYI